jgi:flagellin
MSLSINNNITALNAWRQLKNTDFKLSQNMERLSSGLRINRAADDPAGLVISEKMRAQLVGLDAAMKNSEKAINMIQTAEAALDQVQKLLDKMRQLALDSANAGVNDEDMLQANQDELDEAIASITRIANYTQFGTKKLLDGTLGTTIDASNADSDFKNALGSMSFDGVIDPNLDGQISLNVTQVADKASVSLTISAAANGTAQMSSTNGILNTSVSFTINGVEFDIASGISFDNMVLQINNQTSETGVVATTGAAQYSSLTLTHTTHGSDKAVQFTIPRQRGRQGRLRGGLRGDRDLWRRSHHVRVRRRHRPSPGRLAVEHHRSRHYRRGGRRGVPDR